MIFSVNSVEETTNLGIALGKLLKSGDIVCLTGDLGTGKTHITKGIAKGLEITDYITSPTFTIVNEYKKDSINIYHFDVYRLEDSSEFYAIGGEEYFEKGICIVEWGEMIEDALPKEYIKIDFSRSFDDENARVLNIQSIGDKYSLLIDSCNEFIN